MSNEEFLTEGQNMMSEEIQASMRRDAITQFLSRFPGGAENVFFHDNGYIDIKRTAEFETTKKTLDKKLRRK